MVEWGEGKRIFTLMKRSYGKGCSHTEGGRVLQKVSPKRQAKGLTQSSGSTKSFGPTIVCILLMDDRSLSEMTGAQ